MKAVEVIDEEGLIEDCKHGQRLSDRNGLDKSEYTKILGVKLQSSYHN